MRLDVKVNSEGLWLELNSDILRMFFVESLKNHDAIFVQTKHKTPGKDLRILEAPQQNNTILKFHRSRAYF